ncbi:Der1ER1 [Cardiosporidium cionae]|uniref:Derlin n=1 Tax=Cardiosporidium cionae TaxID=476202 RepID=A0ABQ7J716_9APIC|nr:Der1ER1 [Cardiosporidium cionae]|eukprot:KAF8819785.1 Der1ER1 [Cardiosporidium cionae]
MDQGGPEEWFRSLPPVTKWLGVATFVLTLSWTLQLVDPMLFLFDRSLVFQKLQIWRLFTAFLFIGKFSFGWLMHVYLWVQFSGQLEKNSIFTSAGPGSYLWFILLQMLMINLLGLIFYWPTGLPMLGGSLLFAIIYYWSRRESLSPIRVYFITVKGYQLPFVMLLFHLLMGESVWADVIGWLTSHLYYLIRNVLPSEGNIWPPQRFGDPLSKTPQFLDDAMRHLGSGRAAQLRQEPRTENTSQSWFSEASNVTRRRTTEGHTRPFSGVGNRLGGN